MILKTSGRNCESNVSLGWALLLFAFANLLPQRGEADDVAYMTVKYSRTAAAQPSIYDSGPLELWINGDKIGSVDTGRDATFRFLPADSGNYAFCLKFPLGAFAYSSSKANVVAPPGSTFVVTGSVGASTFTNNVPINLHVILVTGGRRLPRVLSVRLNDQYVERELSREIVNTPKGAKRVVKRTRTFERAVSLANTSGSDGMLKISFAVLSGEIRNKLEETSTQGLRESETIEQTIEIDGNELAKVALVWVERRQLGVANVAIDGPSVSIPFELPRNLELRIVPLPR